MILNDIETAGNADRLLPSNDSAGDVLPLERAETGAPDSAQSPPSSPSPVNLRKRKPMSAGAAFDPSRCPQCGTGSMCSRCKSNLEKEREKSASPRPVPLSVPSKQAKKQVDISRRVAHGSGPLTSHPPARSKEGPAVGPRPAPRALAGAAARSHEKKLIRLQTDQVDGNDLSTSSRMFEFIERFLRECPSCRLDSSVKMQFEEPQMTSSGNLTYRQLAQHVFDLRVEHVQRLVRPVLHRLMAHPRNSDIFNQPVDPVALGIPTYFDKIKNPMDLSTVKGKLQRGAYHTLDECVTEISLVFNNATAFNPPGHVVHDIAKLLNNEFNVELASLKEKLDKEAERKMNHSCSLCQGSCCYLCGEKCLRVEPPILVCHGPCGQKIKKNCIYFVSRDGFMLWCQKCHSGLHSIAAEARSDGKRAILKKDLLKRRLDEEVAESWVRCDTCQRWVHQVCALFNERYDSLTPAELNSGTIPSGGDWRDRSLACFECPLCKMKDVIGERVVVEPPPPSPPPPSPSPSPLLELQLAPDPPPPAVVFVAPPPLVSVSFHGRNRKKPATLSGGDFVIIPLKQSHVHKIPAPMNVYSGNVEKKSKKRGRPEGSVNRQKSVDGISKKIVGTITKKVKVQTVLSTSSSPLGELYDLPRLQGRRGRKPKFRINLGRPEDFNTNLGIAGGFEGMDVPGLENASYSYADAKTNSADKSDLVQIVAKDESLDDIVDCEVVSEDETSGSELNISNFSDAIVNDINNNGLPLPHDAPSTDENENSSEEDTDMYLDQNFSSQATHFVRETAQQDETADFMNLDKKSSHVQSLPPDGLKQEDLDGNGASSVHSVGHTQWTAAGLPRSRLGDFLEALVRARLKESKKHEKVVDSVSVRMISNTMHKFEVPVALRDNFPNTDGCILPRFIPYRQKCIILFQKIQGHDISLFCLYVQEFDEYCPEPNRSRVYIAYLDSIEYFRPRECRTLVYHEILSGYLKWAQARGFQHCHIWACPPQRGDSFIFWCHPPHQRTPSRDRLTSWYNQMLRRGSELNVFAPEGLKNAWAVFFRQYGGRDSNSQSRTGGRPVVYSNGGRSVKMRGRGGRKGNGSRGGILMSSIASSDSHMELCENDDEANREEAEFSTIPLTRATSVESAVALSEHGLDKMMLIQPVCPPIFEGDFWVNECIRIHRFMESRVKAAAVGLDASSAATSTGPLADKAANQKAARDIMKRIMLKPLAYPFLLPVDPVALNIPDYFRVVANPMDLGSIKGKLKSKVYATMFEFAQDMRLTFYNSILYNPLSHPIHIAAVEFLKMLTSLLSDFVSTKLGPNLTPAPEAVTGGLDIWLKKFQLFAGANSIQLSFTAANTATEVTPSNNIALHFDGANDVNVVAIVSEGSTTLDNPCEEKRNMDVSSDCGEHCVASVSKDAEDSNGEVFVDADDDQCDDNHNLMDEDYRHSENYYNDDTEGAGVDQSFRTTHTANTYPAPIGFCRQDSTLNLSHFSTGDGHVNMSPTCEEFGRSSASLLEGSRMSSAVAGIRTSISQQHLPPSVGSVVPEVKFKVAALGLKGVCSLMNDLSKAALRFKDDLFVIRLLNSPLECFSSVKLEHASSPCKNTVNAENNAELIDVWKNWLNSSNLNSEVFLEYFHGVILNGNTTDPDPIMPSPFVDSRHTFLEMCQYRHYQFDSFRRAKHSSMMLLYHLHHPQMSSLRPVCVSCKSAIKEIRWHCELCSHYDLCARCVSGKVGSSHQHPLIPFRVTYM